MDKKKTYIPFREQAYYGEYAEYGCHSPCSTCPYGGNVTYPCDHLRKTMGIVEDKGKLYREFKNS